MAWLDSLLLSHSAWLDSLLLSHSAWLDSLLLSHSAWLDSLLLSHSAWLDSLLLSHSAWLDSLLLSHSTLKKKEKKHSEYSKLCLRYMACISQCCQNLFTKIQDVRLRYPNILAPKNPKSWHLGSKVLLGYRVDGIFITLTLWTQLHIFAPSL